MKDTVQDVALHLFLEGGAKLGMAFLSGVKIHVHFAFQHTLLVSEREGQNVCQVVMTEVLTVKCKYSLMTGQDDVKCAGGPAFLGEYVLDKLTKGRLIYLESGMSLLNVESGRRGGRRRQEKEDAARKANPDR